MLVFLPVTWFYSERELLTHIIADCRSILFVLINTYITIDTSAALRLLWVRGVLVENRLTKRLLIRLLQGL